PVAHGPSRTSHPLSTARMMRIVSTTIHPVYAITATVSTIFMPRENLGLFQRYGRPSGPRTKKRRIRTHTGRWYQRTGAGGSATSTPRILHRRMVVRERCRETRLAAAAAVVLNTRSDVVRRPPAPARRRPDAGGSRVPPPRGRHLDVRPDPAGRLGLRPPVPRARRSRPAVPRRAAAREPARVRARAAGRRPVRRGRRGPESDSTREAAGGRRRARRLPARAHRGALRAAARRVARGAGRTRARDAERRDVAARRAGGAAGRRSRRPRRRRRPRAAGLHLARHGRSEGSAAHPREARPQGARRGSGG